MNNTILIAVSALIVGGLSGYLVAENRDFSKFTRDNDDIPYGAHRMHDGYLMTNNNYNDRGMMGGMNHSMMGISSEKEFLTEMIPHHQEAVDTAKEVLARGATTPEIKTLLEKIVTAQEKEITDMKTWYETWYQTPYTPSGNYRPMMRDLENLSGKEIDRAFLEDMTMHHMGAIMMARSVEPYIEHEEIKNLAKAIITSQSEEIEQMRVLRAGL